MASKTLSTALQDKAATHNRLHKAKLLHPAGTSKDSDKCDLSKDSDIENSMVVNGKIYIFNHPAYVSKDLEEIYIWKKIVQVWRSNLC